MGKGIKVLHQDCDPSLSNDKSLPYTAYLVEYIEGETTKFDLVAASKKVDIFDHYWDKYRNDFVNMTQSEGRVNPKLYGYEGPKTKKKK
jgi:hypothetical protein